MLTPMDIHNHQFKKSIRGYNENEVDDFLDRVVVDFEKLLRENENLKNQLDKTEDKLDNYRKLEKTMNDTLLVAQKTADDLISAARKNADEMKENTARECQNIREQARLEAQQQIKSANVKRAAILEDYTKLVSEKNSFLLKIRTALESELAITVQNLNAVAQVEIPIETIETEEKIQPQEKVTPVEKPIEVEEKIPEPIEEVASNIVDISSKPVTIEKKSAAEKKTVIPEETKIYTFKKSSAPDKEAAK